MRKLIHILHSIILFLKFFLALANREKGGRGVRKHREGGNNILQSKKENFFLALENREKRGERGGEA